MRRGHRCRRPRPRACLPAAPAAGGGGSALDNRAPAPTRCSCSSSADTRVPCRYTLHLITRSRELRRQGRIVHLMTLRAFECGVLPPRPHTHTHTHTQTHTKGPTHGRTFISSESSTTCDAAAPFRAASAVALSSATCSALLSCALGNSRNFQNPYARPPRYGHLHNLSEELLQRCALLCRLSVRELQLDELSAHCLRIRAIIIRGEDACRTRPPTAGAPPQGCCRRRSSIPHPHGDTARPFGSRRTRAAVELIDAAAGPHTPIPPANNCTQGRWHIPAGALVHSSTRLAKAFSDVVI